MALDASRNQGLCKYQGQPKNKDLREIVINRKSLRMEAQLKFVNSNKEGMKIENHFKDEGGEFDQRYVP